MRSGSLFLRFSLVACAAGIAVAAGVRFVLFAGNRAGLEREAGKTLLLLFGAGFLAALLFLLLSCLLMSRYLRKPLPALVAQALQILDGRHGAVPDSGEGKIRDLSEEIRRMAEAIRDREASLTDLVKFTASNRSLVMKVDSGGNILYANRGVEQTLYGMGLPPQHAELLLPDDAAAIAREILASGEKQRAITCRAEGRTIEYTLYGLEDEQAVVFHGVDATERNGMEGDRLPSRDPEFRRGVAGHPFSPPAKTVLLVDGEELVRDVAGAMLASLGYEILSAQDGTEGVEIFRRENARISFTVLDLQTPVMDGNRAIEEIRKIDPAAKIVLSTRSGGDEDADRFREMGAAAVLSKPYSYGEIVRVAGLFPATAPSPLPVQEK